MTNKTRIRSGSGVIAALFIAIIAILATVAQSQAQQNFYFFGFGKVYYPPTSQALQNEIHNIISVGGIVNSEAQFVDENEYMVITHSGDPDGAKNFQVTFAVDSGSANHRLPILTPTDNTDLTYMPSATSRTTSSLVGDMWYVTKGTINVLHNGSDPRTVKFECTRRVPGSDPDENPDQPLMAVSFEWYTGLFNTVFDRAHLGFPANDAYKTFFPGLSLPLTGPTSGSVAWSGGISEVIPVVDANGVLWHHFLRDENAAIKIAWSTNLTSWSVSPLQEEQTMYGYQTIDTIEVGGVGSDLRVIHGRFRPIGTTENAINTAAAAAGGRAFFEVRQAD